jgi:hypothetical protein
MQTVQQPAETTSSANGASAAHELFALTDEQILEIEPEAQDVQVSSGTQPVAAGGQPNERGPEASSTQAQSAASAAHPLPASGQAGLAVAQEPPAWLAAQMKDPWTGAEAKELWNGIVQAQKEAADYRAAIATPEDARALKELYPGGLKEAQAAVERARVLDDIDRAYFGAAGSTVEQTSAARTELAQRMLREDPAAFREMVFAGLRALEQSGAQTGSQHGALAGAQPGNDVGSRFSATSAAVGTSAQTDGGLKSAPTNASTPAQEETRTPEHDARLAAYATFEKAANEDLERSVGATIDRTLQQALPGAGKSDGGALRGRLASSMRQEVEAALKGDRQLGEQVAQILSGRRLDAETRAQVVRLIGERAQQLVPTAAKRVLNDWTQSTLATHRSQTGRADAASTRREVATASTEPLMASSQSRTPANSRHERGADVNRSSAHPRGVDYRKLSDEQILDL